MTLTVKRALPAIMFIMVACNQLIFSQAYSGYTLFGSNNSRYTYLTDMNNAVYKQWTHTKNGGYSYYLLEDGSVMRTAMASGGINGGGAQGVVQRVDWNGNLLWEYTYSSSTYKAHHDIEPLPNGNVLIIAWEVKTAAQAVAAGLNHSASIWPDHIIEVQPVGTNGGNIVWKWHFWDHLIQDYDATKANYGVVANHPELLDINVGSSSGDWMHVNGISYNPELDQIVFSSHNLNEFYVIDHSTTTAEAAGHTGGRWGKGGDILYRWGKPANYRAAGSQVFYTVHSACWIPKGYPGEGHILAFNNRDNQSTSMIVEIVPPVDSLGNYVRTPGAAYGPASPFWSYTASGFFSNHLGGNQRLPNGNTIISESTSGYLFEVNQAGQTVWSYNRGGEIVRVLRYAPDSPPLKKIAAGEIAINEFMGQNDSIPDPAGEFEDWIELYNNSDKDITLSGRYISNTASTPMKYRFPLNTKIKAHDYLIIWADNDLTQSGVHVNFELSAGDKIYLSNIDGTLIDSISVGTPVSNKSLARLPNGTGIFTLTNPTPGAENKLHVPVQLLNSGDIVLNEVMILNDSIPDPADEYDPWIELYNNTRGAIDISGAFLSDGLAESALWKFPENTSVPANGYLIVWLDGDTTQEGLHTAFPVNDTAGIIVFANRDSSLLDTAAFNVSERNISLSRIPNGIGPFVLSIPSFASQNTTVFTATETEPAQITDFRLSQNYPNPFNPATTIYYFIPEQRGELSQSVNVLLRVYDLLGREAATLVSENQKAGSYSVSFDASALPSGIYLYELRAGEYRSVKKMTLLR